MKDFLQEQIRIFKADAWCVNSEPSIWLTLDRLVVLLWVPTIIWIIASMTGNL